MILRRVVENLKHQHWTAIGIELVIVVLGVFIGMQVSNWNVERETDRKAAVFTARLKSDLREEAWGYEMQIGYYQQVIANARRAADALSGRASPSDEALLVAAYRSTQYSGTIRRRETYDELTSTGEIGLIRDEATRDLALRMYNFSDLVDIVDQAKHSEYRHWFRLNMPHEVQQALSVACGDKFVAVGDYKGIATTLDHACSLQLSPQAIAEATAILRSDKVVLPLLRLRIADLQTSLDNLANYNLGIRDGLRAVAGKHP
jgi:hypothetical protein